METNGTLLTPELARWLKDETRVSSISVSLDGANAETHDSFRGVPGALDAALHGLDALVDGGYKNVQVIMSVFRGNVSQVEDVVALAETHDVESVKFTTISNNGRGAALQTGPCARFQGLDGFSRIC